MSILTFERFLFKAPLKLIIQNKLTIEKLFYLRNECESAQGTTEPIFNHCPVMEH